MTDSHPPYHLDQARRDPGVCPVCDAAWARQETVVARAHELNHIDAALERVADCNPDPAGLNDRRYGRRR